jgi:hypothetical protein
MNETAVKPGQLTLFSVGGIIDDSISRVFKPKEIKNAKGAIVGTSIGLNSRKDIAAALDLKGKDNKSALDRAILAQSDAAFRRIKGEVNELDGNWTLKRVANRTMGNGERQISIVLREVKRHTGGPTNEEIAKALGFEVEEVKKMREEVAKLEAAKNLDVESTTKAE